MRTMFVASFLATLLITLTTANVFASQVMYKPLMFRLVTLRDIDAAREFLGDLEGSDLYLSQSQYLNSVFDNIFAHEIDTKYLNLEKNIAKYEALLERNGGNRDVLIKLALLYKDQGTRSSLEKSKTYYVAAKAVDPWVKIDGLEAL